MAFIHIYKQSPFKYNLKINAIKNLVKFVFKNEQCTFKSLNIIFCDDDFLLKINQDFLNHDTYTDIITFNYGDTEIEGELYIGFERLKENSKTLNINETKEILRLIIHGVLHLCGFTDKNQLAKSKMTTLEDYYINFYQEK